MKRATISWLLLLAACGKGRPGPEELVPADARVVGRISSFDRLDKLFAGLPVPFPDFGHFVKGAVFDRGREMLFGLRENGDGFLVVPVDNAQTAALPFEGGAKKPILGYLGYTQSAAFPSDTGTDLLARLPKGTIAIAADVAALVRANRAVVRKHVESAGRIGTEQMAEELFRVVDDVAWVELSALREGKEAVIDIGVKPKPESRLARAMEEKGDLARLARYAWPNPDVFVALDADNGVLGRLLGFDLEGADDNWVLCMDRKPARLLLVGRAEDEAIVGRAIKRLGGTGAEISQVSGFRVVRTTLRRPPARLDATIADLAYGKGMVLLALDTDGTLLRRALAEAGPPESLRRFLHVEENAFLAARFDLSNFGRTTRGLLTGHSAGGFLRFRLVLGE